MNVMSTIGIATMYTVNYEQSLMLLLYCPCLCCHSSLWLCVVVSRGSKCMNLCRLWWFFPLTNFITAHICACPMPWCRFLCYMSWYFCVQLLEAIGGCLRNKSWKPKCVESFNMDWRILVFYPEPEARDKIY